MSDESSQEMENPPTPATGYGPNDGGKFSQSDYHHPAAGWDACRAR